MISVELYREKGRNFRCVRVRLDADSFVIETQDMGPTTEEFWGDSDYEFWTTVPKAAWGDLLMTLAEEFLDGDARATDRLRAICRKRGVRHEWASWK